MVYGARISLTISVLGGAASAPWSGVTAGLVAGYRGGRVDAVIMRLVDLNLAFPLILLALAIVAMLGAEHAQPDHRDGDHHLDDLRARRARVSLGLREREFVQAARAIGAHDARIMSATSCPT